MPGPPKLPDDAKDFAVLCFARYMRPTQVTTAIKERFGIIIERSHVQLYDPSTKRGSTGLGKKRKQLFETTRERFLKELEDIPIANRAVRLQQLQTAFEQSIDKGNVGMGLKILEQAAKESGGSFTAERTVNLTGTVKVEDVSEDEMRNGLAAAIAAALETERERLAPPSTTKH